MFPAASRLSEPRAGEAIRSRAPFAYRQDAFEYDAVPPSARPSTKKAPEVVRIRRTPQGTQLRKVAGDGNCFYSCVAHALQPADPAQPGPTAAVIRAQTCAHMTKYTESYSVSTTMGKECTRSRTMFGECRPMLNSWAGGLELLACAPAHRICIVMFG